MPLLVDELSAAVGELFRLYRVERRELLGLSGSTEVSLEVSDCNGVVVPWRIADPHPWPRKPGIWKPRSPESSIAQLTSGSFSRSTTPVSLGQSKSRGRPHIRHRSNDRLSENFNSPQPVAIRPPGHGIILPRQRQSGAISYRH